MINFIKIVLIGLVISSGSICLAGEPSYASVVEKSKANEVVSIKDRYLNSDFSVGYSSFTGFLFNIRPAYQFQVSENLFVGPTLDLTTGEEFQRFGFGAIGTYYFSQSEKWSSFFSQAFLASKDTSKYFRRTRNKSFSSSISTIGFFRKFSGNFELGPSISYLHVFDSAESARKSYTLGISIKH